MPDRELAREILIQPGVYELLDHSDSEAARRAAADTFLEGRNMEWRNIEIGSPVEAAEKLVELGCCATLGDLAMTGEFRKLLDERGDPGLPIEDADWSVRVWASVLDAWLWLLRGGGRECLTVAQQRFAALRAAQRDCEPDFVTQAIARRDARAAWELISAYHLGRSAELLAAWLDQEDRSGSEELQQRLDQQFEFAIRAAARGGLARREVLARMISSAARRIVASAREQPLHE